MTQIAVVDVGTNTTRLYLAEVVEGRVTKEILRTSRVTRLGAGVDASGRLAPEALAREHATLADYAGTIGEHQPDRAVAVMTSAVRDAANGEAFADEVAARYGLDVHVLSGDEEARLTYLGATDGRKDTGPVLVVDIGGGSTESSSATTKPSTSTSPRRPASCARPTATSAAIRPTTQNSRR